MFLQNGGKYVSDYNIVVNQKDIMQMFSAWIFQISYSFDVVKPLFLFHTSL